MQLEMTQPFWLAALLLALPPLGLFLAAKPCPFRSLATERVVGCPYPCGGVARHCNLRSPNGDDQPATMRGFSSWTAAPASPAIRGGAADAFTAESLRHAGDSRALVLPFATEPATVGDPGTNPRLSDTSGTDLASAIAAAGAAIAEDLRPPRSCCFPMATKRPVTG